MWFHWQEEKKTNPSAFRKKKGFEPVVEESNYGQAINAGLLRAGYE